MSNSFWSSLANFCSGEARPRITLSDLWIKDKKKNLVRLVPNPIQEQYLDQMCPAWRTGDFTIARGQARKIDDMLAQDGDETPAEPPAEETTAQEGGDLGAEPEEEEEEQGWQDIILKSRQFGFTTILLAVYFLNTVNNSSTATVIIAHDAESTQRIFQIVQRFYRHLPPEKKPYSQYANRREYYWPELDSSFFVGQAGSGNFGRGTTINNAHLSEVAFWPNPEDIFSGLLNAVPTGGNITIESTANGLGNLYEQEYRAAEKPGGSTFTPRFYPWFEMPEYRLRVPRGFRRTEEEQKLVQAFGIDDGQLAWRRWKKLQMARTGGKFEQEFPATVDEAFIASGHPYFNRERVQEISNTLPPPLPRETVLAAIPPGKWDRLRAAARLGQLEVWELPQPTRLYVAGADTAEGLTQKEEADFDSADVADGFTWAQTAHLHGKWDTHYYGMLLAELGWWYNTALVGVERNNHGHAVLNAMLHSAEYPSMNSIDGGGVYYHEEYDEVKKIKEQRPGWPTTPRTKTIALDGLATSVDNGDFKIRSRKTTSELMTYVKLPGGKAGAEGKCHDDAVVSCAILDALLRMRPRITASINLPSSSFLTPEDKDEAQRLQRNEEAFNSLPPDLAAQAMRLLGRR